MQSCMQSNNVGRMQYSDSSGVLSSVALESFNLNLLIYRNYMKNFLAPNILAENFPVEGAFEEDALCANCGTTVTPLWRRSENGERICNACGLYYKLHRVSRPVNLSSGVIRKRRRSSSVNCAFNRSHKLRDIESSTDQLRCQPCSSRHSSTSGPDDSETGSPLSTSSLDPLDFNWIANNVFEDLEVPNLTALVPKSNCAISMLGWVD